VLTVDFARLGIRSGQRILDIGCGSGRHACAAHRRPAVMVIGADLRMKDLAAAREALRLHDRLGEHGGGHWALSAADVCRLPFRSNAFDRVICSEVLEHVPDDRRAAAELARVLKPDGTLAVSVPRQWPERICWRLSKTYCRQAGGHIRIYRQKSLIRRLRAAGLRPLAVHHAHGFHTPYWWLKCLVGPQNESHPLVRLYHRFLVWEMMKNPRWTRIVEKMLNPVMGKSLVVYFRKNA
jgi:SAM-dependent methyltransferase